MTSEPGITEQLARFVSESTFESLPPEAVTATKRAWLDTVGVTLAGSREDAGRIALDYARQAGAADESTVLGSSFRTTPTLAALVNGTYGHALDFDDVSHSLTGHPSVGLMPAVLALGERGGKNGRAAILAFAVGFEVTTKLGRGLGRSSYLSGWHATSVGGSLGAAAAAAKLLDLDVEATRNALGIATSMAGGSRQNFGTMTKPLHAGLAARNGVEAALLASLGFTADQQIIESPLGFGPLFSPDKDWNPERVSDLGEPWDIVAPGLCVKQYPCCYNTHLALDASLKASGGRSIPEAEIDAIDVRVAEGSTVALIHHRPVTGLAGKFSMEYCIAASVLDGAVKLRSFEDEAVGRPEAQRLLRRVNVNYVPLGSATRGPAEVSVRLKNGSTLVGSVTAEHGSDGDPLTWDELVAKYRDCAGSILPADQVERSLAMLSRLEDVGSLRDLTSCLAVAGA